MTEFFLWYGIIWLIGLIGLPFSFTLFSRLPDRGYAFSRPLGLWLITMVAWWIGNLKLLPFIGSTCWLVLGLVALVSLGLGVFKRRELRQWFTNWANLRLVIVGELFFLAGYAFIVNFCSFLPSLNRSEKFFDYGFINAIAISPTLPPPDPWFGGVPMNYYYGGQLYMAVLCKLSGLEPSTGYNLGMGLVYALAVLTSFGLGSNLIGLSRGKKSASLLGGIIGASFIMILGNIDAVRQFAVRGVTELSEGKFPPYFDWPATARMIYDPMPDGRKLDILTEYPIYSFLNGDLHAHLLDLPFVGLALAFILHLFVGPGRWVLGRFVPSSLPKFLAGGFILGAPFLINAGDFPTYLALGLVALTLAELRAGGAWLERLGRLGTQAALLVVALLAVYLPYLLSFNGMIKGIPLKEVADVPIIGWFSRYLGWIDWPATFLAEYFAMFGLFLFPIITFFLLKIIQLWRSETPVELKPLSRISRLIVKFTGVVLLILALDGLVQIYNTVSVHNLTLTSSLVTLMALPVAVVALWPGTWRRIRATKGRRRLLVEGLALLVLLGIGTLIKVELLGLTVALLYFSLRLGWRAWTHSAQEQESSQANFPTKLALFDSLFFGLIAFAAFISLFVEFFYVRDIYNNRFNTMFKFWYQIWMLYGVAAVYATWQVFGWRQRRERPAPEVTRSSEKKLRQPLRWVWLTGLGFLMVVATACPLLGYWEATDHYNSRQGLNGEAWYARDFPAEYPAMRWLRDYTREDPARRGIVVEANGMNYSWYARISTYTGLPTLVGWPFHELQWRATMDELIIWEAWLDLDRIYATTDNAKALEMLQRHNVRYVFVGQLENGTIINDNVGKPKQYSPEALAKFASFMKTIYADPKNNIFIYAFD
ncbi:MAG: hypothetical protein HXX20_15035 [Chloroflexi bacterium]|nr:hypothetical protein [Chloroflexota bacterium]